jgi:hypothetical protein
VQFVGLLLHLFDFLFFSLVIVSIIWFIFCLFGQVTVFASSNDPLIDFGDMNFTFMKIPGHNPKIKADKCHMSHSIL